MKKIALVLVFMCSVALFASGPVPFTLRNTSMNSISLWIPGVMNPNLSPVSNSGVDLKPGQKIYFKHRGKKYLLLEVSEKQRDQTLNVPKLIKARKAELGLNRK